MAAVTPELCTASHSRAVHAPLQRSSSRKKSRRRTTASASSRHLLGPKAFPLDRLFAIFYSILDETSVPTAETYIQVGSLVSLKLLAKTSSADNLDAPKYKCLVQLADMLRIAHSIGFELGRHLVEN
eukprot:m.199914 g.199914  ORF g.199914 m.199914 type:complete len:127 (-) comp18397_c1_seq13:134-514(-)